MKKKVIAFCIVGITMLLIILIINDIKINKASEKEILPTTYQIVAEDTVIINPKALDRIRVIEVRNSTVRSPVSYLMLDSKYPLFIYKLDSTNSFSMDSIDIQNIETQRSTKVVYQIIGAEYYKFQYKAGSITPVSSLILTFGNGRTKQLLNSDSIVSYIATCKNISLRYGKNEPVDIYIDAEQNSLISYSITMNVLFIKKGKNTYLLMLSADNKDAEVPEDLLVSIINR